MIDSSQLLGISNAIVDVIAHVDEEFLEKIGAHALVPSDQLLRTKQRKRPNCNYRLFS